MRADREPVCFGRVERLDLMACRSQIVTTSPPLLSGFHTPNGTPTVMEGIAQR